MTSAAVSGGAPPSVSDTAIATPAVIDFGASETSTARGAPSARATRSAETIATNAPTIKAAAMSPSSGVAVNGERGRRRRT